MDCEEQPKTRDISIQYSPKKKLCSPNTMQMKSKIKILQQKVRRQNLKIMNMKELISSLKQNISDSSDIISVLENNFMGLPLHLMLNQYKNDNSPNHKSYTEEMKQFSLTLSFYSPKAYRLVPIELYYI